MTERTDLLDPSLVEGPRRPTETLRPAVSAQRVLFLDGPEPQMADLATGDIRRWENGPPVSVPCTSSPVDLRSWEMIQFQVLRDPRPTSVDTTLLSLAVADESIDVIETVGGRLHIRARRRVLADGPIGGSPAVVVAFRPSVDGETITLGIRVRNAESAAGIDARHDVSSKDGVFTIGGPSTALTGARGRRRLIPVHLEVARRAEPGDVVSQILGRGRRAAGVIRRRIQR